MKNKILLIIIALTFLSKIMSGEEVKVKLQFPIPNVKDASVNGNYYEFSSTDLHSGTKVGEPCIPYKVISIIIPLDSEVNKITINDSQRKSITLSKTIVPIQPPHLLTDKALPSFVQPASKIYKTSTPYPGTITELLSVDNFNGCKIATIKIMPYQYMPTNNILEYYESIELSISFISKKSSEFKENESIYVTEATQNLNKRIVKKMVENKDDVERYFANREVVSEFKTQRASIQLGYEYVIITSEALAPAFDKFIRWKKRKGLNIGVVTMESIKANYTGDLVSKIYDDAGKVRQFLKESFGRGTTYVLLGGDETIIPLRYGYPIIDSDKETFKNYADWEISIPTDFYYSEFTGNWNKDNDGYYGEPSQDNVVFTPQVYVGRLLCSKQNHIDTWTKKVIIYEKKPGFGDYSYLNKLFITEADQLQYYNWGTSMGNKFSSFTTKTLFFEKYNNVKAHYSSGIPEYPTGQEIIDEYNKNHGLVSFMGHGSPCDVAVGTRYYNDGNVFKHRIYTYDNIKIGKTTDEYNNGGALTRMANYGYPNIYYSISCINMPCDKVVPWAEDQVDDTFAEVFTSIMNTGGVAFLGNTRNGWVRGSGADSRTLLLLFGDLANSKYSLGIAEALSKKNFYTTYNSDPFVRYLVYTHNLIGCPEMKMWVGTPSVFSNVTISKSGNNVTINTNVSGCKICIIGSADNDTNTYFSTKDNVSSHTFTNVPEQYSITITKDNYIPYLYDSDVILSGTINGVNLKKYGRNFNVSNGVVVKGNSILKLERQNNVTINGKFEVQKGSSLIID